MMGIVVPKQLEGQVWPPLPYGVPGASLFPAPAGPGGVWLSGSLRDPGGYGASSSSRRKAFQTQKSVFLIGKNRISPLPETSLLPSPSPLASPSGPLFERTQKALHTSFFPHVEKDGRRAPSLEELKKNPGQHEEDLIIEDLEEEQEETVSSGSYS